MAYRVRRHFYFLRQVCSNVRPHRKTHRLSPAFSRVNPLGGWLSNNAGGLPKARAPNQQMQNLLRLTIAAIVLISVSGCSSHLYYDQAMQYVKAVEAVLIDEGKCSSESDCRAKQLIFFEAGGVALGPFRIGGVVLNVFEQSKIEVVSSLEDRVAAIHSSIGGPSVRLTVFRSKHSEVAHVLKQVAFK